jgi:hypothetical protein
MWNNEENYWLLTIRFNLLWSGLELGIKWFHVKWSFTSNLKTHQLSPVRLKLLINLRFFIDEQVGYLFTVKIDKEKYKRHVSDQIVLQRKGT